MILKKQKLTERHCNVRKTESSSQQITGMRLLCPDERSGLAMTKMKKNTFVFLLVSCFLLLASPSNAQKLKQLITDGDKAFADNDFFAASIYYNKAILQDSSDMAIQYKYAEASRLNYDYDIADHWYSKVFKKDSQGKLYPECSFWLAMIKKNKGKYKDAKKMFDKYAKKNKKKKDSYFVKKAIQEVAACDYAQLLMASPDKSISMIHLDSSAKGTWKLNLKTPLLQLPF